MKCDFVGCGGRGWISGMNGERIPCPECGGYGETSCCGDLPGVLGAKWNDPRPLWVHLNYVGRTPPTPFDDPWASESPPSTDPDEAMRKYGGV